MARHGVLGAVGPPGLCRGQPGRNVAGLGCQGNVKNMGLKMVSSELGKSVWSVCQHHPGKEIKGSTIENGLQLCEECMKCPSASCHLWVAR